MRRVRGRVAGELNSFLFSTQLSLYFYTVWIEDNMAPAVLLLSPRP